MKTGILNRATSAKATNEQKTAEEELKLGVSALSIDYRKNTTNSQTFREFVTSNSGANLKTAMGLETTNTDLVVENAENGIVSYKGQKYQVSDLGEIGEYETISVKLNVGGLERKITEYDNMNLYYGAVVTNYTIGGQYRIFYIDFEGKYGAKGTIYLKADYSSSREKGAGMSNSHTIIDTSILRKMNPNWWKNRGNTSENWDRNEYDAAYLCDPTTSSNTSNQAWINYFDENKANYVIGSPSIEMYCDSYNKVTHPENNDIVLGANYRDDTGLMSGSLARTKGYVYTIDGIQYPSSNGYFTGANSLDVTLYGSMYCGLNGSKDGDWWLSSPAPSRRTLPMLRRPEEMLN